MARKYYWLKLSDDFFKDKTIKKINCSLKELKKILQMN